MTDEHENKLLDYEQEKSPVSVWMTAMDDDEARYTYQKETRVKCVLVNTSMP